MSSMKRRGKKGIFTIFYRDIDGVQHMKSTRTNIESRAKRIKKVFDAEMEADKQRLSYIKRDQELLEVVQAMLNRPLSKLLNTQIIEAEPHAHNMMTSEEFEDEWAIRRQHEEEQQRIAQEHEHKVQQDREEKKRKYNTFDLDHIDKVILEKNLRNIRNVTICTYRSQIKKLKKFGVENLLEFLKDKQLLNKFVDYQLNKMNLKPITINQKIKELKSLFGHVCSFYNYDNIKNPFSSYKKMRESVSKINILSHDDLVGIIRYFEEKKEHELMFIFVFAGFCGLRRNELKHLDSSWIDIDNKKLVIPHEDSDFESKSHKSRVIPLSDFVIGFIEKYNKKGKLIGSAVNYPFSTYKKKLKWNFKLHDLRHSYACNLLKDNVSMLDIKSYMGHSSFTETERYLSGLKQYI